MDLVVSGATQTQNLQRCQFPKIRSTLRGTRARQLCNPRYIHYRMSADAHLFITSFIIPSLMYLFNTAAVFKKRLKQPFLKFTQDRYVLLSHFSAGLRCPVGHTGWFFCHLQLVVAILWPEVAASHQYSSQRGREKWKWGICPSLLMADLEAAHCN